MRQCFGEKLLGAVVLLAILAATVATATDYTVSITGIDEKILDKLKTVENVRRVSRGLTPFTTSQYMTWATTEALRFKWRRVRPRLIGAKSEAAKNAFVGVTP